MEPIQSTAGAVPILNEKGEVSMQKVKVHRYISGKRPKYAPVSSSEGESENEDFLENQRQREYSPVGEQIDLPPERLLTTEDRRLKRLIERKTHDKDDDDEDDEEDRRIRRRRYVSEPEIVESHSEDENDRMEVSEEEEEDDEDDDDEDLSDEEIERRRRMLRQKVLRQKMEQGETLEKEDEKMMSDEEEGTESSEYEEYTDSEEEGEARLKPIFTQKEDRSTLMEKEKEAAKKRLEEIENKRKAEERRRQSLKLVEEEIRKEQAVTKTNDEEASLDDVHTDDENDEVEYEMWKLRELKRNKRDKEEREQREREMMEIERLRNMTEDERKQELRLNPKVITNKSVKGKYKFMQKYYHRGAFYLDKDDTLFKRNFATATLDDHFDKTVLPKVMQVKNFGRSGRTKYTHLVDQDTTQFDSPWISETPQNLKFHNNQAAGTKQVFTKPTIRKNKK